MSNISYRVSKTKLFKEKDEFGIEFCWETEREAVFSKVENNLDLLGEYYLMENFITGEISVTDSKGTVVDKTGRVLNLFRLGI